MKLGNNLYHKLYFAILFTVLISTSLEALCIKPDSFVEEVLDNPKCFIKDNFIDSVFDVTSYSQDVILRISSLSEKEALDLISENNNRIRYYQKSFRFNEFRDENSYRVNDTLLILSNGQDTVLFKDLPNNDKIQTEFYFVEKTNDFYILKETGFKKARTCLYNIADLKRHYCFAGDIYYINPNNYIIDCNSIDYFALTNDWVLHKMNSDKKIKFKNIGFDIRFGFFIENRFIAILTFFSEKMHKRMYCYAEICIDG